MLTFVHRCPRCHKTEHDYNVEFYDNLKVLYCKSCNQIRRSKKIFIDRCKTQTNFDNYLYNYSFIYKSINTFKRSIKFCSDVTGLIFEDVEKIINSPRICMNCGEDNNNFPEAYCTICLSIKQGQKTLNYNLVHYLNYTPKDYILNNLMFYQKSLYFYSEVTGYSLTQVQKIIKDYGLEQPNTKLCAKCGEIIKKGQTYCSQCNSIRLIKSAYDKKCQTYSPNSEELYKYQRGYLYKSMTFGCQSKKHCAKVMGISLEQIKSALDHLNFYKENHRWCSICAIFKPNSEFYENNHRASYVKHVIKNIEIIIKNIQKNIIKNIIKLIKLKIYYIEQTAVH